MIATGRLKIFLNYRLALGVSVKNVRLQVKKLGFIPSRVVPKTLKLEFPAFPKELAAGRESEKFALHVSHVLYISLKKRSISFV